MLNMLTVKTKKKNDKNTKKVVKALFDNYDLIAPHVARTYKLFYPEEFAWVPGTPTTEDVQITQRTSEFLQRYVDKQSMLVILSTIIAIYKEELSNDRRDRSEGNI